MKKIQCIGMVLILTMALSACSGGSSDKLTAKDLTGSWTARINFIEDETTLKEEILPAFGFEEAEIAFADPSEFGFVRTMTFSDDGSYVLEYDMEQSQEFFKSGFDSFITDIYENLDELSDLYGEDAALYLENADELKIFFAEAMGFETVDEYLDAMSENVITYYLSANENRYLDGKYEVKKGELYMDGEKYEIILNSDGLKLSEDGDLYIKNK